MSETFALAFDTSDLIRRLEELPKKVMKEVVIDALTDAGHVMQTSIKQAVVDRSPRGASGEPREYKLPNGNSIMPELLAEDIDIDPYISKGNLSCNVEVGPTALTGYVARWINNGWMHVHGGRRFLHGKNRGKGVEDEQIPGAHFMEAGADESAKEAADVFCAKLASGIEETYKKS